MKDIALDVLYLIAFAALIACVVTLVERPVPPAAPARLSTLPMSQGPFSVELVAMRRRASP